MALTVNWDEFSQAGESRVRHRYPQPIDGFVCRRCIERVGRRSHNCIELICSCECPELAAASDPDEEPIFDGSAFHGRRRDIDADEFIRMGLPVVHVSAGMKQHAIRKFGRGSSASAIQPIFWRMSLRLHDCLIYMACSRPQHFSIAEVGELKSADEQISAELKSLCAKANKLANEFKSPLNGSQQKWRVLRAVISGQQDAYVISGMLQLPPKHVSAWLSVLEGHGYIERIGEWRQAKVGHAFNLWRPVMEAIKQL